MRVGFTGTRVGLTDQQLAWLYAQLESGLVSEAHHGACTGADAAVHQAVLDLADDRLRPSVIHVWPPTNPRYRAEECLIKLSGRVVIHPEMPYLERNREIVNATAGLVALPLQNEQPASSMEWGGTWYTVNFAERMNRPVTICYPNGVVEHRNPIQPLERNI